LPNWVFSVLFGFDEASLRPVLFRELDLIEITRGVNHANDFDAIVDGSEKEAVFAKGIAAAIHRDFWPRAAKGVPFGKVFEFCSKPLDEPVSLELAVVRNVVPNLTQISLGNI
jgi:hypothetical protein